MESGSRGAVFTPGVFNPGRFRLYKEKGFAHKYLTCQRWPTINWIMLLLL